MVSLFFRNLLFTILQPGIVAGLIPFWIIGSSEKNVFDQPFRFHHFSGALIFVAGLIIMLTCIAGFAIYGRGTLSPADPTKKLVVQGFYRFSRNPMYVGVMLILIGESMFFLSTPLAVYALFIFIAFNTFIIYVEEPRLLRDFGEAYNQYRKKVRRWI